MPFHFSWFCDLLEELDRSRYKRTLTTSRIENYEQQIVCRWFSQFDHKIERRGPAAVAFLSCLLPERRPDRVYNLQAKRLSQIFGRALGLGASRALELNRWQTLDGADFASCVETTLQNCENDAPAAGREVTLEEIDEVLDTIAGRSVSSSPAIRAKSTKVDVTSLLTPVLRRLKSNEAKWFVRMLLKNYAPVEVPEREVLRGFHFMMPNLLDLQNSFEAAVAVLARDTIRQLPARPDKSYERALQVLVSGQMAPQIGIMIRRQPYHKARSIKHCCNIANQRQMSVERKYDGEYCQIHIDLSRGSDSIQIFSKSGKDSTRDRFRLHSIIREALRLDLQACRIRRRCILEGELLVWSDSCKRIQPFHKIRKYVRHGGRDIGNAQDSPKRPDEHLMIAFYDILLLDEIMLLSKSHRIRRQYLKQVLQTREGNAILCERTTIDFKSDGAPTKLRKVFASAITNCWEGLVLKGLNEPYFSWNNQHPGIKLKKDYIVGMGDTADLCLVGGRRDPQHELQIGLGPLAWTTFYIGAVCNKAEVERYHAKPLIKIVDILTHHSMPKSELLDLNRLGRLYEVEYGQDIAEFDVDLCRVDLLKPSVMFKPPFIVEVMGAGFVKPPDSSFYALRFPRKIGNNVKLHTDRTIMDTTSFDELQILAEQSINNTTDEDSQEDAKWIERLTLADGEKRASQQTRGHIDSPGRIQQYNVSNSPMTTSGSSSISPVFVRPDTEEPEHRSFIAEAPILTKNQKNHHNRIDNIPLSLTSGLEMDLRTQGKHQLEAEIHDRDSLTLKKRRLSSPCEFDPPSPFISTDNILKNITDTQIHSYKHLHLDKDIRSSSAFSPPAEFYSPTTQKRKVRDSLSLSSKQNPIVQSHITTKVSKIHSSLHTCKDKTAIETSFALRSTDHVRPLVEILEFDPQTERHNPSYLLPTPPTSSPPIPDNPKQAKTMSNRPTEADPPQKSRQERTYIDWKSTIRTTAQCVPVPAITVTDTSRRSGYRSKTPRFSAASAVDSASETDAASTAAVLSFIGNGQQSTPLLPPILLLNPPNSHASILQSIQATFTYSPEEFIRVVNMVHSARNRKSTATSTKDTIFVILVDTSDPQAASQALKKVTAAYEQLLSNMSDTLPSTSTAPLQQRPSLAILRDLINKRDQAHPTQHHRHHHHNNNTLPSSASSSFPSTNNDPTILVFDYNILLPNQNFADPYNFWRHGQPKEKEPHRRLTATYLRERDYQNSRGEDAKNFAGKLVFLVKEGEGEGVVTEGWGYGGVRGVGGGKGDGRGGKGRGDRMFGFRLKYTFDWI